MARVNCLACALAVFLIFDPSTGADEPTFPGKSWPRKSPAELGLDAKRLDQARDYALTGGGSGIVIYHGHAVLEWGDQRERYDLKSTTKSLGATLLGVALLDGKVKLDDPVVKHHPAFAVPPESNRENGWIEKITLRHLATQSAGFEKRGGFEKLSFEPGTKWQYSDGGPNWLAECLTLAYREDLDKVMFERVLTPLGIGRDDYVWRKNQYRPHEIDGIPRREFGSGVSANVESLSRIGYLYLRGGVWNGKRIFPADFVAEAGSAAKSIRSLPVTVPEDYGRASDHYGLLWWNNADGTLDEVPRDAFWSWGLYDSLIVVIPSLDIVVARAGQSWKREPKADHYDVLRPFLTPIAQSPLAPGGRGAGREGTVHAYPPSPVIAGIDWARPETIVRLAKGRDNWPTTWGADDFLYTARLAAGNSRREHRRAVRRSSGGRPARPQGQRDADAGRRHALHARPQRGE
jgi:CubicO group peptidase (beta-lactamase class C family)